jgi:hypothetical protein
VLHGAPFAPQPLLRESALEGLRRVDAARRPRRRPLLRLILALLLEGRAPRRRPDLLEGRVEAREKVRGVEGAVLVRVQLQR